MRIWGKRAALTLAALAGGIAVILATPALAQSKKSKSTQTEAVWMAFDATTNTITVKVDRPGKGPNKKMLKKGQEAVFKVKPEGSVLTRTTVAINGVKGELGDIPAGKSVNVYWVPEGDDVFFARKVDVVLSEEELNARSEEVN